MNTLLDGSKCMSEYSGFLQFCLSSVRKIFHTKMDQDKIIHIYADIFEHVFFFFFLSIQALQRS